MKYKENAKNSSDSRDFRTFCFNFVFHHNKLSLAHSLLALIMINFRKGATQATCHACGV